MDSSPASNFHTPRPWNIRDVLAAVVFFVISVLMVLATVQLLESIRGKETGELIASSAFAVVIGLLITTLTLKLARVPIRKSLAILGATLLITGAITVPGEGSFTESSGNILGIPTAVYFIAIIETLLFITALLFTRVKYAANWAALGLIRPVGIKPFGVALGYWALALLAIGVWAVSMRLIGADKFLFPETAEGALTLTGGSLPVAIILVGIWGPFGEELFFRGFVLAGLRNRFGLKSSVLISSVAFGLVHVAPGAIIPTFFLGLAFAWIYVRTRSLVPAIFVHCLQNTIALVVAASSFGT